MPESLAEFFTKNFRAHQHDCAYRQRRGYRTESFTYGQVLAMAQGFARELAAREIVKGERVMLWGENSAEWVAAFFACAASGVIAVPLDDGGSPDFAKRVCDRASCGACTTIVDGDPVYSCTTLAIACQGKRIETLESFDTGASGVPHAFHQNDGLMCGYCTPGFVTAAKALLDKNPNPSEDEIRTAISGGICRCTGYKNIVAAIRWAAEQDASTRQEV